MKTECLDHRSDFPVLHIKSKSSIGHTNIVSHLLAADRNFVTTVKIKLLLGNRWLWGWKLAI
jgi:N-acyl-L-homoserine lactone synthetase